MKNSILIFAIFFAIFSCGVVGEKDFMEAYTGFAMPEYDVQP